jgi:hypothetical protein
VCHPMCPQLIYITPHRGDTGSHNQSHVLQVYAACVMLHVEKYSFTSRDETSGVKGAGCPETVVAGTIAE